MGAMGLWYKEKALTLSCQDVSGAPALMCVSEPGLTVVLIWSTTGCEWA